MMHCGLRRRAAYLFALLPLLGSCAALAGCASRVLPPSPPALAACRLVRSLDDATRPPSLRWFDPLDGTDRRILAAWCQSVGPVVVDPQPVAASLLEPPIDSVAIVSWNTHVGGGDLSKLIRSFRSGAITAGRPEPFVVLLQEVYRRGGLPSAESVQGLPVPRRIRAIPPASQRQDIIETAKSLGLALFYAPSMRNGRTGGSAADEEDRGNAIMSTLPLSDFTVIELPFEKQRRVAVAATVTGRTSLGAPWKLRVSSAHLDNLGGARRLWIFNAAGRARQARGLLRALDADLPTVLGGDFNTWSGHSERAYTEIRRRFGQTPPSDPRPTFVAGLRLDHLFFRLAPGWTAAYRRLDDRFGSDHYPLVGRIDLREAGL